MKKLLAIAFVVLLAACQPNNTAVKTTQQNTYTPSFVVDYQKVLLQFLDTKATLVLWQTKIIAVSFLNESSHSTSKTRRSNHC